MTTTETQETTGHVCCWHTPAMSFTLASNPPRDEEVCCHCGAHRWVARPVPPIPAGHGPHYPPSLGGTLSFGPVGPRYLGGCNCALKAPTIPVFRGRMTHLDDCPAKDSGVPVGVLAGNGL